MRQTRYVFILLLLNAVILAACTEQWSATGTGGIPFDEAARSCRVRAEASAKDQLPLPYDRRSGPAGFPSETREDIAARETAWCLKNKGFTLSRSFR